MTNLAEVASSFSVSAEDSSPFVLAQRVRGFSAEFRALMAKQAAAPVFGADYLADSEMVAVTRVQARPALSREWAVAALWRFSMSTLDELRAGGPALLRHELDCVVLENGMREVVRVAEELDGGWPLSAGQAAWLGWLRGAVDELLRVEAAGGPLPAVWRTVPAEPTPDFRGDQAYMVLAGAAGAS